MKKFLFISAVALCCFCMSCKNNSGGMSATAQKNMDANHAIQKAFESKDFSKIGDYIAEDGVDHAGMNGGDVKGLANLKTEFEKMAAMTENDKTEIVKEMADDDYVMCWSRYSGKMKNDGMGMKAGENFNMSAIDVSKFKDGKVVEHWSFMDMAEMMKMMPPPSNMSSTPSMPADTTKKDTTKKM
jgi:predicted ester cyclase